MRSQERKDPEEEEEEEPGGWGRGEGGRSQERRYLHLPCVRSCEREG